MGSCTSLGLSTQYSAIPVVRSALLVAVILALPYGVVGVTDSGFGWGPMVTHRTWSWRNRNSVQFLAAELNGRVSRPDIVVTYLIPIVYVFLGVVFRNDSITLWAILGTVCCFSGSVSNDSHAEFLTSTASQAQPSSHH